MPDGNKRYLGDVFINRENAERQRQFFRDVIDSYQYKYGGSFDAATLQGLSLEDFATREQGEKADNALMSPLLLGKQSITNKDNESQFIFSDAIKLDPESCLADIDWYQDLSNNDITEALCSIYNNVSLIKEDFDENGITVDYLIENDYERTKNVMLTAIEEVEENGSTVSKINADLVNGLRFIPITQEAYNNLSTEDKNYWRNVYIIKEAADLPNIDNLDDKWTVIENWRFNVVDGNLCFNNGISDNWDIICPLEDLLTDENIGSYIEGYLGSSTNFENILRNISTQTIDANWNQYPFLSSSLHNEYVYDITVNNNHNGVYPAIDMSTNLKTVDIDFDEIIQGSSDIININSLINTNQNNISSLNNQVSSIGEQITNINSVNNSQQSLLNDINNQLTELNNKINSINASLGKWETQIIPLTAVDSQNQTIQSICTYNRMLGVAHTRLAFTHYHTKGNNGWVYRKSNATTSTPNILVKAQPMSGIVIPCWDSPTTFVRIEADGRIKVKSTSTSTGRINIIANAFYRISEFN